MSTSNAAHIAWTVNAERARDQVISAISVRSEANVARKNVITTASTPSHDIDNIAFICHPVGAGADEE